MFRWFLPWTWGDGPAPVAGTILSAESTITLRVQASSAVLATPADSVRLYGGGSPFANDVTLAVPESTVTLKDP